MEPLQFFSFTLALVTLFTLSACESSSPTVPNEPEPDSSSQQAVINAAKWSGNVPQSY